jgi:hypothetical protein
MFGNEPDRFVSCHPIAPIETCEINRARITAQRSLETQIEINVEVAHRELTQAAINRFAIAASGKVRFGNGAPIAAHSENRNHVIRVVIGF